MKSRRVGKSGLKVSEITLGSWLTTGKTVDESISEQIIDEAMKLGIYTFDTSNNYENGKAEIILGNTLRKYSRSSYVIQTKGFFPVGDNPNERGLSRKHLFDTVNASLSRLQIDYIDVFYCHRFDAEVSLYETLSALNDLVKQGKIMYIGVSEWNKNQIQEACDIIEKYNLTPITVIQPRYHMLERYVEKNGINDLCELKGIGITPFSSLCQGLLTGKYYKGHIPPNSRLANDNVNGWLKNFSPDFYQKADRIHELALKYNIKTNHLALSWLLSRKQVCSVIIGATSIDQLRENIEAPNVLLNKDILNELEKILGE